MNKDDELKKDEELKDAEFRSVPGKNGDKTEEKKQESSSQTPENKDEKPKAKEDKKKDDIYDKFKYWGSDNSSSRGPGFGKGKNLSFIIFLVLIATLVFFFFTDRRVTSSVSVPYSQFIAYVKSGVVSSVDIQDQTKVLFNLSSGTSGNTRIPYFDSSLLSLLEEHNVTVSGSVPPTSIWLVLIQLVPWIIFGFLIFIMFRQMGAAGGSRMMSNFGKSHAQQANDKDKKITFKDVAGQKEAKYELEEVVDFLKHPERFVKIGAKIPKGVLLVGPPGTGKTLLAKAVAGEAGVSFFHTSGSDFVEMFVGMGAARVRDLFEQGRKNAPCILFIDELDAVGRSRGSGLGGGHDEREQTLNQMLVEMDGFSSDPGIIVIAATNRPDVLDPALLRPGRFDRQVVVDLPDVQERLDILRIHTRKVKLDEDVDLSRVARATPGSSGADLANLVNEAALFAARKNNELVSMIDFENARDKIILGVARESKYMTEEEKRATSYHEAGHTLLHYYLKNTDPLHKVTIVPHGRALGLTISLPEKDKYTLNKSTLLDRIKICMGGYVAEKIVYGETTTGTSNDIKQATELAHRMVTEWGMSDIGFIGLANDDEPIFLGREIAQHKNFSDSTAKRIDDEMLKILNHCMSEATNILTLHRDQLEALTDALCEKETLDDSEIRQMFGFPPVQHTAQLI